MPVNQLAYSQSQQTDLIQIAKLGGSGLLDFLLIVSNAALAEIFIETTMLGRRLQERVDQISAKVGCWVDAAVVLLVVLAARQWGGDQVHEIASATRPDNFANFFLQTPNVPIGIIQGNVTIEEDRLKTTSPAEIDKRYTNLSRNLGVQMLAYPEGLVTANQMAPELLLGHLKGIALHEKKEVIVGSIESFKSGKVNAARLLGPITQKQSLYVKRRLVPFGEFAPLGAIGQGINDRLPLTRESFVSSRSTNLLRCMWGGIGTSICIELVYPHLISDEVRHGAHLLVNISNLGWFHQSSLHKQILAAAILRAVENGRYLVISANTGVSAVIDPAGVVTSAAYPNRRGVLLDTVQFLYSETPFSKMWWL
jgi:apolipoprotein N-acyltransferase